MEWEGDTYSRKESLEPAVKTHWFPKKRILRAVLGRLRRSQPRSPIPQTRLLAALGLEQPGPALTEPLPLQEQEAPGMCNPHGHLEPRTDGR